MDSTSTTDKSNCRIDKWLWAARFFKTRNPAKQAIEGGKVHYDGQRVKTSKIVDVGAILTIRCGWDYKTVEVLKISDQRKGAPEAQQLYIETADSILLREQRAAERKASGQHLNPGAQRPTKKQRR